MTAAMIENRRTTTISSFKSSERDMTDDYEGFGGVDSDTQRLEGKANLVPVADGSGPLAAVCNRGSSRDLPAGQAWPRRLLRAIRSRTHQGKEPVK